MKRLRDPRLWIGFGIAAVFLWIAFRDVDVSVVARQVAGANWAVLLGLSIPAYLLAPAAPLDSRRGVMALHGHATPGNVDHAALLFGLRDDYHHAFGLELASLGSAALPRPSPPVIPKTSRRTYAVLPRTRTGNPRPPP